MENNTLINSFEQYHPTLKKNVTVNVYFNNDVEVIYFEIDYHDN